MLYPTSEQSVPRHVVVATILSGVLVVSALAWEGLAPRTGQQNSAALIGHEETPGSEPRVPEGNIALTHGDNMRTEDTVVLASADDNAAPPVKPAPNGVPAAASTAARITAPFVVTARNLEDVRRWLPAEDVENALEVAAPAQNLVQERVVVRRGDTLMQILLRAGIARAEAHEALTSLQSVYDPRRLRIGQYLDLELAKEQADGTRLAGLSLNLDFESDVRVARVETGGFDVETSERELVRRTEAARSVIEDSLYLAGRRAEVHDDALMELIRLFSWDVDFQHDIHAGDSFDIVYDVLSTADGEQTRVDYLQYASLELRGTRLEAYRFVHANGSAGYYDADGRSVRKWLMRTPIDGARLSSGFGKRRHPILGYTKMHKGTDFAAPKGTPIYAAGDGVVTAAGRKGAYGKYIRIRHNREYSTAYAHLSGYAKGLKKGLRVEQGQVIGYVGSTGRSTGPHLHYEVLENDRQINPMKVKKQVVARLEGAELAAFRKQVAEIVAIRDAQPRLPRQLAQNTR